MNASRIGLSFSWLIVAIGLPTVVRAQGTAAPAAAAEYAWEQVTLTAEFAPRDGAGALSFDGKMWLLGGWNPSPSQRKFFPRICNNEVWSSPDGKQWTLVKPNTFSDQTFDTSRDWEGRHTAGYVVFNDHLWIIGGDCNQKHYQNDIWTSKDGRTWQQVNPGKDPPWAPRALHYTVVHDGKIWVIGGQTMPGFAPGPEKFYRDLWTTTDGVTWTEVRPQEPCWSPRGMIGGSAVLGGRLWILGGGTYDTPTTPQRNFYNDVWSSADGVHWKQHTAQAPWHPRQYHDVAAWDGKLWVMEGYHAQGGNRKDVWYSADGEHWQELPNTPWKPRHAASLFVHQDSLWMVAGNNMEPDVWRLKRTRPVAAAVSPNEPDHSADLPKVPPRSPEKSLQAIRLKAGFHAELVASEPLIRSPMAMDFDEWGRAYVVELPEYNQYGSDYPQGRGSVRRLEDTDGDGRYDRATTYVSDLNYPTAVACWKGGILVGVAPDILYCLDTDGDGQADVRRKLFTGFGQDKAGEGMLNSFRWRFDNRFHIPCGLDGGEVIPASEADAATPPPAGVPPTSAVRALNVRGQHLLLEPRSMKLELTSGGGQHGMSLDDWLRFPFVCGNSEPVHLIMYDGRYLSRNPYLQAPAAAINIAPEGKFTKLMRASPVEPWRVLRTKLRSEGTIPGSDEGGTPSGFFTGATGITVYRGDAWPAEYRGQVFVGEVANNLVYRAKLSPQGVGLTALRADPDAEFLASTDNWFRPVQFANAPDGTLYVLDMYRGLIEGAAFLAPRILKHIDAGAGYDMGRIYRIAPDGFRSPPPPRLGDRSTVELVSLYEHSNGWHRDTASRLIYERQDQAAVEPLRKMARESRSTLAQAMALYSLQGLGALTADEVLLALRSQDSRLREHGLRLAESFPQHATIREAARALAADSELRVRYQAAFSLGSFPEAASTAALVELARRDGQDSWMQMAILSSVGTRRADFLAALLSPGSSAAPAHLADMTAKLVAQIGAAGDRQELSALVGHLERLASQPPTRAQAEGLIRLLLSQQPALSGVLSGNRGGELGRLIAQFVSQARDTAAKSEAPVVERVAAIRLLAAAEFADIQTLCEDLLHSRQPQPVQVATVQMVSRFAADQVAAVLLAAWPAQTPALRANSLETLLARSSWTQKFLDAVEQGQLSRNDLDPARVAVLQRHPDPAIRRRAEQLFAGGGLARRAEVVDAYQPALNRAGDVDRGRAVFRKTCAACHRLENTGESIGADLNAIRDRGSAAVLLNILDPNREVKPQFLTYSLILDSGQTLAGMIVAETANSVTLRKADNTTEQILRVRIEEMRSTGLSFMPEGLEKQVDVAAMADLLAYLNATK